jgi:cobalt-zinc-cadmium efflux system outer membrane protein
MSILLTRWLPISLSLLVASAGSAPAQPPPGKLDPVRPPTPLGERIQVPPELPGRDAPTISLPEFDPGDPVKQKRRREAIERTFPSLGDVPASPKPAPGLDGHPLSLADLQRLATANNPTLKQAVAAIEVARGNAVQAGLYPNPTVGYEGDTIGQASSSGIQGGFVEQVIKTAGKLQLARASALVDVAVAEIALRRATIDVATQVRRSYFAFLVAERTLVIQTALARMTGGVYSIQVARLSAGEAAVYEPLQARVLAIQARGELIRSRNRYYAAWRELASSLGIPQMAPTQLQGSLDIAVPVFAFDAAKERMLAVHTDVLTALRNVNRAQIDLRRAEVTPIPDLDVRYLVQQDNTTFPFGSVHSVVVGIPVPLWNRNQGAIRAARATLAQASLEPAHARNTLVAQLATAIERYDNARSLVLLYRDKIVPDQVRAYRNLYRRYDTEVGVLNFNDVITSQQTLSNVMSQYVVSIGELWASVVEIAALLQIDDLFGDGEGIIRGHESCPVPALEPLPPLRGESDQGMPPAGGDGAKQAAPEVAPPARRIHLQITAMPVQGGE